MNRALLFVGSLALICGTAFLLLRSDSAGAGASTATVVNQGPPSPATVWPAQAATLASPEAHEELADGGRADVLLPAGSSAPGEVATATSEGHQDEDSRPEPATLVGRVTNADGLPVEGADVSIQRRGIDELFMRDLDEGSSLGVSVDVTADAEGRFSVETRPGEIKLVIEADGFAPFSMPQTLTAGQKKDLGDQRLAPGVVLRGRVVDVDGQGIEGARFRREVKATAGITILGGDARPAAVSGPGGEFEISRQAAGAYRFYVEHPRHPSSELSGQLESPGEIASDLLVTLGRGAIIRGVAAGLPLGSSDLEVYASPEDASGDFDFGGLMGKERSRTAKLADDGSFEVVGLAAGLDYSVRLVRPVKGRFTRTRCSLSTVATALVGGGAPIRVAYSDGASVSFSVVDEEGRPMVPDVIEAGFDYVGERENAEKDPATGRCTVRGLWPAEEGGRLGIRLAARGFVDWKRDDVRLLPGEALDLGRIVMAARPSVRVTVLDDATDEPVQGASVIMTPYAAELEGAGVRSISMRLSSDSDEAIFNSEEESRGTTDAEGVCELDATAGAAVTLKVDDGRHAPEKIAPLQLPESMTVFEQEVRLMEGGQLRVVVRDPGGNPAVGYPIEFKDESTEDAMERGGRTDGSGELEVGGLRPGRHFVRLGKRSRSATMLMPRIRIPGMEQKADEDPWFSVDVLAGEVVVLTLESPAIGRLAGEILELGAPLGGATVKLRPAKDDHPLSGLMGFGGTGDPSATTDARGEFLIEDVEAGEYELVIEHATRAMPAEFVQEIEGGLQERELDLSVTEVTGLVTDDTGAPVAGARVEVKEAPKEGARRTVASLVMMTSEGGGSAGGVMMSIGGENVEPVQTNEEGRYRLRGVRHGVELVVSATAEGYDSAKSEPFTVSDGSEESDVDIQFRTPGAILIEVDGLRGRMMALVRRAGEGPPSPPQPHFLTEAKTRIDSLAPGTWNVSLRNLDGGGDAIIEPESIDVEVRAGQAVTAAFKVP